MHYHNMQHWSNNMQHHFHQLENALLSIYVSSTIGINNYVHNPIIIQAMSETFSNGKLWKTEMGHSLEAAQCRYTMT